VPRAWFDKRPPHGWTTIKLSDVLAVVLSQWYAYHTRLRCAYHRPRRFTCFTPDNLTVHSLRFITTVVQ
jgi:hypothetical protein